MLISLLKKTLIIVPLLTVLLVACTQTYPTKQKATKMRTAKPMALLPRYRYDLALNRKEYDRTLHFIRSQLTGPYGINTNWKDSAQMATQATGHEVLSESYGLMLESDALAGKKQAFKNDLASLNRTMTLQGGWSYRFSPKQNKKYPANASVDDLRILLAIRMAAESFHQPEYKGLADKLGKRFVTHMLKKDKLVDFYDQQLHTTNNRITLCYIRLRALNSLPINAERKKRVIRAMSAILHKGYLSDRLPFYQETYDYATKTYRSNTRINTIESLLTILNLSEQNREKAESIAFIKEKVKKGNLYNAYTKDGRTADSNQSAANYALAAMIAATIGDHAFYQASVKQMQKFEVLDKKSRFYGGFGDAESSDFYSYNNLTALLAYQY
ncbi:MAG: hypothetical protein ACE3JK_00425 [Sporolactobacillus sp.]